MRAFRERSWDGISATMLAAGGYVLLASASALAIPLGDLAGGGALTTLAIVVAAVGWIYVGYTRVPEPKRQHQGRLVVFFVGLVVLASILMLRQPLFFVFMISGFFYATTLRPFVLTVAGIAATSVLVNSLLAGLPTTPTAWTFYCVIIVIQTVVLSVATFAAEKVSEQNDRRRDTVARLEQALAENAGLHVQLLTQAREAGVLEERQRMAREIHDTIAQGLTGIITQLQAARHAGGRPGEHDRHLANADRLARESLSEARRSV